ncbi:DEAD/DEAH box helicase [Pseudactinotalea sp. Z1732]|uniref:DEAD/DEAH box helicase n=1 Tax=Micrococcales TaxID=85006 RepID=UPI003C7BA786
MASPAERYAAARARARIERSQFGTFEARMEFELDDFQREACLAVQDGHGVLVAAPTGAGKTVVGEFAVDLALATGRKAFYTTPIKALSNQKYLDLAREYGTERVGLLTGDTSINSEAPVVVMTTEVLRNMLYGSSPTLAGLGFVVMDEVHYLADKFRGPVWEEVILHLAGDVQVVSLSATVSNAEEFGEWLTAVRGDTAVIVAERRPVPLWQHVMVGSRMHDLYAHDVDPTDPGVDPPISPDLIEAIRTAERPRDNRSRGRNRHSGRRPRGPVVRPAPRSVVVEQLDRAGLLPAIVFVFSRAGCEGAVAQLQASGIRLTTVAEEKRIAAIIEERCADLPPEDLQVLNFWSWSQALRNGIAAHHAGMLPVFKETVEALFTAGLVKVVFATETLALGINMPARSVVLERLTKWDGQTHAEVTPGEYTQLTGRAGRRGIDTEGHAVVLYSSGLDPVALAGLASRRTYPLRSSFRPTYNMAVNLIARAGYAQAREVLETSFAQFQADRGVVGLARRARRLTEAMDGYAESMRCHLGDFAEYMDLRRSISDRESELSRARSRAQRQAVSNLAATLRRGDVIQVPSGRRSGHVVVLEAPSAPGLDGPVVSVITADARLRKLSGADLPYGTTAVTRVRIPKGFNPRKPAERRDVSSAMRTALGALAHDDPATMKKARAKVPSTAATDDTLGSLKKQLRAHPCHGCSDREEHARWFERWHKLRREREGVMKRIEGRTSSIARDFDRVCDVLLSLGYLRHKDDEWSLTGQGSWLRRLYSEKDLVLAECLRSGLWDGLNPAELAAVVSGVLFQSRSDEPAVPPIPGPPDGVLALAATGTARIARQIAAAEADRGLSPTEPVDLGMVRAMYRWASGRGLEDVLEADELAAGDFVRWAKQVLDVLDQLTHAAPQEDLRTNAREAIRTVRRGIVAHGTW